MQFEDHFNELDRLLAGKSTDYEKMRATLQSLGTPPEIARITGPAQDNLYASIACGHRKALTQLESGDIEAAKQEMAGAVAWFLRRFEGFEPQQFGQLHRVVDELRACRELAERCEALKVALKEKHDIHAP